MTITHTAVQRAIIVIAIASILTGCLSLGKKVDGPSGAKFDACLLYTSDAAEE